ncbi:MAG TPA: nucleotide exchange factor GrpE [Candidatus Dietzia intestinigallinarum]|nr:nucleotide exchange factor GrpE [Candidatus Dietzia intestinigallinarum]
MTSPHADGPETDKAAWAGGDAETVDVAEAIDEAAAAEPVAAAAAGNGEAEPAAAGNGEAGEPEDETVALQDKVDELTSDLQRVSAEFANYRRRMDRERTVGIEQARAGLLSELLPVVDDLDRAREHGDLEDGPLKAFADKMVALLASQGVEQFGEEGDPFDPNVHEAVQDESSGGEPVLGTVLRKGYRMGERTLRTAMVIVR